MTRKDLERAQMLADELVRHSRGANQVVAEELRRLLEPMPSITDIMLRIPGETHKDRIKAMGLSPQGYYNLMQGHSRPNTRTAGRLAKLTGLPEELIRQAGPGR